MHNRGKLVHMGIRCLQGQERPLPLIRLSLGEFQNNLASFLGTWGPLYREPPTLYMQLLQD